MATLPFHSRAQGNSRKSPCLDHNQYSPVGKRNERRNKAIPTKHLIQQKHRIGGTPNATFLITLFKRPRFKHSQWILWFEIHFYFPVSKQETPWINIIISVKSIEVIGPSLGAMGLFAGDWTLPVGIWTLPVGNWTLPAGIWILPVGIWTLPVGIWTLPVGIWTLPVGSWTLPVRI